MIKACAMTGAARRRMGQRQAVRQGGRGQAPGAALEQYGMHHELGAGAVRFPALVFEFYRPSPFETQASFGYPASLAAARRSGPACATSAHVAAHRRQASAHFRMVSPLYLPHSAAQAVHSSEQTPQTRWANSEVPVSRGTQVRHSSRHWLQSRMHSFIIAGSCVRASSRV